MHINHIQIALSFGGKEIWFIIFIYYAFIFIKYDITIIVTQLTYGIL